MKKHRLILMRHGQAEAHHVMGDHARALSQLGHRQVSAVAGLLRDAGWMPQVGFYSDAARTTLTQRELQAAWEEKIAWHMCSEFYLGRLKDIDEALCGLGQGGCAIAVGHNPGWSQAASALCGEYVGLDTACAALLSVDAESWEVALSLTGCWTLHEVVDSLL